MLPMAEMKRFYEDVRSDFDQELEEEIVSNVCVFHVPKSLSSAKPQAYSPQLVGLGPYHHYQLIHMERVKLDVVKKLHKEARRSSFNWLVNKLSKLDPYVRTCYHKFLLMESGILSWMMTLDAHFLFDLLCQYGIDKKDPRSSTFLQALPEPAGKKLAEDAILRDVMMLENQIPIFFMEKMLTLVCALLEVTEQETTIKENFPLMLERFCNALSPLKETIKYTDANKALKRAHLLDLLYSMVVKREDEFKIDIPADLIKIEEEHETCSSVIPPDGKKLGKKRKGRSRKKAKDGDESKDTVASEFLETLNSPFMESIQPHVQFVKSLMDLYSQVTSIIGAFAYQEAPAEEKALIPTASSLSKAGVKFGTKPLIENISFEDKTCTFQLPEIKLSVNSEVVMRNLVAYEAMTISGPLVFAHFMELMDGLIDTTEDVKLLRKHGIITGLPKDDEVTNLFNSMSHSIGVNGYSVLDETIKKVNEFYNANMKTQKMIKRYAYGAWKILVAVATVLFFLFMALQAFCYAYGCSGLINKKN